MGNPKARVKLVEYGSLTCPHCAISRRRHKPLVAALCPQRPGQLRISQLRAQRPDIAVSLLARCAGPANFFADDASRSSRPSRSGWSRSQAHERRADEAELEAMTDAAADRPLGRDRAASPQIAARFGVTPARARQCLADRRALERLLDMTKAARRAGRPRHADLPHQRQGDRTRRPGRSSSRCSKARSAASGWREGRSGADPAAQALRLQELRRAGRAAHRAGPDRHRRARTAAANPTCSRRSAG